MSPVTVRSLQSDKNSILTLFAIYHTFTRTANDSKQDLTSKFSCNLYFEHADCMDNSSWIYA